MKYILAILTTLVATQVTANNCAPREVVVERLADRYGEARVSVGLASNNSMVETFANSQSGSWTIVVTRPGGPACLVAAGEAFQLLDEALPAPGIDG